ncbi:AbiJ-NTD4 domain-containing protein [Mucilaginibacter sp.]|uniref:AbiJ-NTD4 domain-containing protein n=1 Tax=Mucilaginibacter sp. TaxID=1882438 RepID=UPI002622C37C|nr:hypothetical protein [Mucilaginibacter sp.]MDB4925371.1 hypothetical protein [Mucilaginibacter sp.]
MTFFSDRELGKKIAKVEEIDILVWNGVVAIFESFLSENAFSKNFPENCPDNRAIAGCNHILLNDKLKALVPKIDIPISRKEEFITSYGDFGEEPTLEKNSIDTFAILDFIEFCFQNMYDAVNTGEWHDYWGHYHLTFKDTGVLRKKFVFEINLLFERNGIAFKFTEEGKFIRLLNPELGQLISVRYKTSDAKLNELLIEATSAFVLPKEQDRFRATEKLWDSFERIKTYCDINKKTSIEQLIKIISNGNAPLEKHLDREAKELTDIGNNFQIRHFEQGKQEINDVHHIDYLFHRLLSLINLMITKLP